MYVLCVLSPWLGQGTMYWIVFYSDISWKSRCKSEINPNWHGLRKQEVCSSLAPQGVNFYKTQWGQINPNDVNFHRQKSLEIFEKNSADKIWTNKDKGIKMSLPPRQIGLTPPRYLTFRCPWSAESWPRLLLFTTKSRSHYSMGSMFVFLVLSFLPFSIKYWRELCTSVVVKVVLLSDYWSARTAYKMKTTKYIMGPKSFRR